MDQQKKENPSINQHSCCQVGHGLQKETKTKYQNIKLGKLNTLTPEREFDIPNASQRRGPLFVSTATSTVR